MPLKHGDISQKMTGNLNKLLNFFNNCCRFAPSPLLRVISSNGGGFTARLAQLVIPAKDSGAVYN